MNNELSFIEFDTVSGGASADYFLEIDGVDGEATDDKHKGEIQLESFRVVHPKP
jgi:type VI protein secretion system component Hcp